MERLQQLFLALIAGTAAGLGVTVAWAILIWFDESELRHQDPVWFLQGWIHVSIQILIVCTSVGTVSSLVFTLRNGSVRLFRVLVYVAGFATVATVVGIFFQPLKGSGTIHWFAVAGAICGGTCVFRAGLPATDSVSNSTSQNELPTADSAFDVGKSPPTPKC